MKTGRAEVVPPQRTAESIRVEAGKRGEGEMIANSNLKIRRKK